MNLNGRTTNPGEMRTSITLEPRTVTQDAGGFQVPGQGSTSTVWCKWTNVHGSEVWAAAALQALKPATVVIRYHATINTMWTILKGSERYEIVSIDNIRDMDEYMELKVQLVGSG